MHRQWGRAVRGCMSQRRAPDIGRRMRRGLRWAADSNSVLCPRRSMRRAGITVASATSGVCNLGVGHQCVRRRTRATHTKVQDEQARTNGTDLRLHTHRASGQALQLERLEWHVRTLLHPSPADERRRDGGNKKSKIVQLAACSGLHSVLCPPVWACARKKNFFFTHAL